MGKKRAAAFLAVMVLLMVFSGFGGDLLIEGRSLLFSFIGQSGSDEVILGRDGFLFFAETMPDYLGEPIDIEAISEKIKAYSDALKESGIGFTFLCAPNKNSIYPEYMPYYALAGENSLPLLNERLEAMSINVVDAHDVLIKNKPEGLMYHRTDSHWNAMGALRVYQQLMNTLGASHADYADAPLAKAAFRGDLTRLYRPLALDLGFDYSPRTERAYETVGLMRSLTDMRIETLSDANDLNVLVLRDSFGEALFPYLANNMGRMVFSRQITFDEAIAIDENVTHVVLIIAQRDLQGLLTK